MILQALVDYYETLARKGEISPLGWCMERVSYSLNLAPDGRLLGVVPQLHQETKGKKQVEVPDSMQVPERTVRSSGIKANFLCDNTTYLLGFDNKGKPRRSLECFAAARTLHLEVLKDCRGKAAQAVRAFFTSWQPENARQHPALQPYLDKLSAANLVFRMDGGDCAQEDAEIRQAWQDYQQRQQSGEGRWCLVTGRKLPVAQLHGKIKGVPDAQSSGANLISYNESAYESYGNEKAQGLNASVSEYAAFAYVTALNHLLADTAHRSLVGDAMTVYWSQQADSAAQDIFKWCMFAPPDDDRKLDGILKSLAHGDPVEEVDMNQPFYILGLAPNAARISVRFFLQDTFGSMLQHLQRHYERLNIQKPSFDRHNYLSLPALLYETVNPNSKDKKSSPLLSGEVLRSILTGQRYPESLYHAVLERIRAEKEVTRGRAAIIKAYLIHNYQKKEVTTVALNKETNDRAYVLGRLFAVLEDAQKQALPGINATIKDRYFSSACATPGNVFPQLLKLSVYHTAKAQYGGKLEREKGELLDKLEINDNPFPKQLSLQDQGSFQLGYYQQVQERYKKKEEEKDGSDQ